MTITQIIDGKRVVTNKEFILTLHLHDLMKECNFTKIQGATWGDEIWNLGEIVIKTLYDQHRTLEVYLRGDLCIHILEDYDILKYDEGEWSSDDPTWRYTYKNTYHLSELETANRLLKDLREIWYVY